MSQLIEHARRQARAAAKESGELWCVVTWKDDFEPKELCVLPVRMADDQVDILEYVE